MGATAEELRGELAVERASIGADLEAIGDRVSPGRMVQRRRAATRQRFDGLRERVMGTAEDLRDAATAPVSSAASSVAETMSAAPEAMRRSTGGNPLAAGLVAFGVGLVVATLLPETETEQRLAEKVQPQLEELASSAGEAAHDLVEAVKPAAQEAAQEVAEGAQHAVGHVKEQAAQAVTETTEQAKGAVQQSQ
jgi:ElaB/YqjD/DUF883 family membrane-anchored ribosome-binding protein